MIFADRVEGYQRSDVLPFTRDDVHHKAHSNVPLGNPPPGRKLSGKSGGKDNRISRQEDKGCADAARYQRDEKASKGAALFETHLTQQANAGSTSLRPLACLILRLALDKKAAIDATHLGIAVCRRKLQVGDDISIFIPFDEVLYQTVPWYLVRQPHCSKRIDVDAYFDQVDRKDPNLYVHFVGQSGDSSVVNMYSVNFIRSAADLKLLNFSSEGAISSSGDLSDLRLPVASSTSINCDLVYPFLSELRAIEDFLYGKQRVYALKPVNTPQLGKYKPRQHTGEGDSLNVLHRDLSDCKLVDDNKAPIAISEDLDAATGPQVFLHLIVYLKSIPTEELKKLPTHVHAGDVFGEVFEELSKEGSSLAYQQPAEAQSRYLLTKFELGWLSVRGEEIARLVAEEEWAKAAEAWVSVNDKLFTMKERMEPWHDLWTLYRD
eukprot:gene36115-43796_t